MSCWWIKRQFQIKTVEYVSHYKMSNPWLRRRYGEQRELRRGRPYLLPYQVWQVTFSTQTTFFPDNHNFWRFFFWKIVLGFPLISNKAQNIFWHLSFCSSSGSGDQGEATSSSSYTTASSSSRVPTAKAQTSDLHSPREPNHIRHRQSPRLQAPANQHSSRKKLFMIHVLRKLYIIWE